jgi:hypothetical protein
MLLGDNHVSHMRGEILSLFSEADARVILFYVMISHISLNVALSSILWLR